MYINPRRQKSLKKKITVYLIILAILGCLLFFLNSNFIFNKPLFISPLGKDNSDVVIVEKNLKEKNISFSQVSLSDSTYLINISNNGQVKLSSTKDIGKQITSLQRILVALTIEGKPFKSIDFRFEEPIISF